MSPFLRHAITLAALCLLSTLPVRNVSAHEIRPSVADITITGTDVHLKVYLVLEPLVAGIVVDDLDDTNQSPKAAEHDELRALDPDALRAAFLNAWPTIAPRITIQSGGTPVVLSVTSVEPGPVGNVDLPRDSSLVLSGQLPAGAAPVTLTWGRGLGLLALRQTGEGEQYEAMLAPGETSAELPREGSAALGFAEHFTSFMWLGFIHIVPKGLDHILFVLGLFLFAPAVRPLLAQVTAFTLAHTLTLALATLGLVQVAPSIVEPLIALSIAWVAAENILGARLGWQRIAVVFGFGLLHGLGFASVLGDIGLSPARFLSGLIGFNLGVEFGQIAVIALAWLVLALPFAKRPWYRQRIAIPASLAIGAAALWWAFERVFL